MNEEKKQLTFGGVLLILAIPLAAALAAWSIYNYRVRLHEEQGGSLPYRAKTPEEWAEIMSHTHPGHREKARNFLIQYEEEALPHLEELLRDKDDDTARLEALYAAGDMGSDAASLAPLIRDALADRSFPDRDIAAITLLDVGDVSSETEQALVTALKSDPEPAIRVTVARCLGRVASTREAVTALANAYKGDKPPSENGSSDPDPWASTNESLVKDAAADALQRIADRGDGALSTAAQDALD